MFAIQSPINLKDQEHDDDLGWSSHRAGGRGGRKSLLCSLRQIASPGHAFLGLVAFLFLDMDNVTEIRRVFLP
jgi:hypothetical protein